MASRFLPSHAKGSIGETMIYKVFWPPFENPFLRPLAQLFYLVSPRPGSSAGEAPRAICGWSTSSW